VAKPAQPTAPSARVSPLLIVLLILAGLGVAAFFVWKYVLENQDPAPNTRPEPAPPSVKPLPLPPPPPPPPPASKIVMETPAPDDIKTSGPGQIETILGENAAVKAGDVIVKLVGDKPIEAEIASATLGVKRAQDQIDAVTKRRDAAQAAGNQAAETELADRQKTLAAKQALLATKTTELDKFLLHAPSDGAFTPAGKLGQKVAAGDVVAKLQRDASAVATFKVADTRPFAANASIEVAVAKGEQHVTCTIALVQADSVKVACPADPALAEGTEVTLKVPGASAPEHAPAPPRAP